jgi:hypothetical protein
VTPLSTRAKSYPTDAGEQPVGIGAVTHHEPDGPSLRADEGGNRTVGFARDLRLEAGRRRHCSDERTVAGNESVGHRKGRVGVGRDEASSVGNGVHGTSYHVVVERLRDAHDHGVGGPVVHHGAASGPKRLENTVGADGQDAIARVDHRRGCHGLP